MGHLRKKMGFYAFVLFLYLLFASGSFADQRTIEDKHGGDVNYEELYEIDYHKLKKTHGSKYNDGKRHGQSGMHGDGHHHHGHGQSGMHGDGHHHHGHGQSGMHGDGHHHVFSLNTLKKKLNLTNGQVNIFLPIEADYKKEVIQTKADIRIAEIDLGLLISSQNQDRERLKTVVESIGQMKSALTMARIDAFLKIKQELTVEQQEKFSKMVHTHMTGYGHTNGHQVMKGHHGSEKSFGSSMGH